MNACERLCPWLAGALAQLEAAALAGRLGHGWLIRGAAGSGKINLAYVVADRLLRHRLGAAPPATGSPGEIVAAYAELAAAGGLHPDLHRVRPEEGKRSIAVEQIREMTAELALTPHIAGLKVVVIEQAESMTTGAANALLKSLEEPTPATWLFLLAERPGRLPATIRSRCQQLALRAPDLEQVGQWLLGAGLAAESLPARVLRRSPVAAAALLSDPDKVKYYNILQSELKSLYQGRADPHGIAESWHRGDTSLALGCLIESLEAAIRRRLVPGPSNPITDDGARMADNPAESIPADALFAGLGMAENLREQLGRGINVELALRALLLGLEPHSQRVNA